ncbi:MAG: hypothetical protein ABI687_11590 [Flavitalea sp.]
MKEALLFAIVFRQLNGKTVISAYPDMSECVLSPKQLRINDLMKAANHQVKTIMADEMLRNEAQLRLNVTRNKLYTSPIREFFKNAKDRQENSEGFSIS